MEENYYVGGIIFTISIKVGFAETMGKVYTALIEWKVKPQDSPRSNLHRDKSQWNLSDNQELERASITGSWSKLNRPIWLKVPL